MNFLAHLYLSGDDHEITVGNFIADHVKGSAINGFSAGIQRGIRFHRAIDQFTDSHDQIREAVEKLRPGYKKYAGVVMDMYSDHFLASAWSEWSNVPIDDYTASRYEILMNHYQILPARTQYMLQYMVKDDWLSSYAQVEGIGMALRGMSRRTTFVSNLENAIDELKSDYDFYKKRFDVFFPEMILFAADYLKTNT
jgi:acyl carrier protein phosphodiesterase